MLQLIPKHWNLHKYLTKYKLSKLLVRKFNFQEPGEFLRFLKASSTSDQSLKAPFYLTVNGFS